MGHGTFDTPKKKRNSSNRSKKKQKTKPKKATTKSKKSSNKQQNKSVMDDDFSQIIDNDNDIEMMQSFEDDNFNHYDSPNLNENDDEKQEIETQRSDNDQMTGIEPIKSTKNNKSKKKKSVKTKTKKGAKRKKRKTKKTTNKKKKTRKRKVYETDISYSSDEPDKKRPRLSQIVKKETSVPPGQPNV